MKKILKNMVVSLNLINIFSLLFYFFRLFKIDNKKVIFLNFSGKGYGDNPKYIANELIKLNKYKLIWFVDKYDSNIPKEIKQVKIYSISYFYHMSTSKIWVNNSRMPLFVRKRKKQFYINTWHGGLGLKKIEKQAEDKLSKYYLKSAPHDSSLIDLLVSNSTYRTNIFRNYFWYNKRIVESGCPRTDLFFDIDKHVEIVNKIKKIYSVDSNKKIILYAPTFRTNYDFDYNQIDFEKIISDLNQKNNDYIFFVRLHSRVKSGKIKTSKNVIDVSDYPDVYDILISADILISDYSSVFFDYIYLNRPIYLFAPDYNDYLDDRGINFEYNKLPFPISYSSDELSRHILQSESEKYKNKLEYFINSMNLKDDGLASKRIVDIIELVCRGEYNMKKYKIGYTQGTYDLFHVGHLNIINNAKKYCDYLVVGVNSDRLVKEYKNKEVVINEDDRARIVSSIKGVDEVIITDTLDKLEILKKVDYDAIFIGDDWKNNERWIQTKKDLEKLSKDVIFLPHTDGISTTDIAKKIK